MDILFKNYEMDFEWDDNKNSINKKKHGISFETATAVFGDDDRYEELDEAHSIDEERYKVIGYIGKYLSVIFTERGERTRIISARLATATERKIYNDFNS